MSIIFALKSAKLGHSVAVITKKERSDTNTNHAQGGIASVMSKTDDFESHVKDTLIACNQAATPCNEIREIFLVPVGKIHPIGKNDAVVFRDILARADNVILKVHYLQYL